MPAFPLTGSLKYSIGNFVSDYAVVQYRLVTEATETPAARMKSIYSIL
jgi:hypothetical protein